MGRAGQGSLLGPKEWVDELKLSIETLGVKKKFIKRKKHRTVYLNRKQGSEKAYNSTRGVEAFLKKTAIASGRDPSKKAKFWWYAIAVFFKNASTPRVGSPCILHSKNWDSLRYLGVRRHAPGGGGGGGRVVSRRGITWMSCISLVGIRGSAGLLLCLSLLRFVQLFCATESDRGFNGSFYGIL